MTASAFPPHIRTADQAIDFLPAWAETFGGVLRDGIDVDEDLDDSGQLAFYDVKEFHVVFEHASTVLTVALSFDPSLNVDFYKFDLRRTDGTLLWREDNHVGHEQEHGGPHHLHIGPEENHRVPTSAMTFAEVAEKVVSTHISRI